MGTLVSLSAFPAKSSLYSSQSIVSLVCYALVENKPNQEAEGNQGMYGICMPGHDEVTSHLMAAGGSDLLGNVAPQIPHFLATFIYVGFR